MSFIIRAQENPKNDGSMNMVNVGAQDMKGMMGFDRKKTTEHYRLLPDGGVIEITASSAEDTASRDEIRQHLGHIAQRLADGNFRVPMLITDPSPAGVPSMEKLKGEIQYKFEEVQGGAVIRITTSNPEALHAIHQFLQFQIQSHKTGDSLDVAGSSNTKSLYAGQESRTIKALSDQEIQDYLDGKGLGYARAAELNHYPGPRHVLDVAKELGLTDEQKQRTQALFEAMKARAIPLGKQLVEKERELDRQFASGSVRPDSLKALVSDIGSLQAQLQYVHLSVHLEQKALLSEKQLQLLLSIAGLRERTHSYSLS